MEPADLNSSSRDDASLEALLRRPAVPLPDNGFSARVLAALPREKVVVPSDGRWRAALAGAVVGMAFAIGGVLLRPSLGSDLGDSLATLAQNITILGDPLCILALGIAALSLYYVFRPKPHQT